MAKKKFKVNRDGVYAAKDGKPVKVPVGSEVELEVDKDGKPVSAIYASHVEYGVESSEKPEKIKTGPVVANNTEDKA